MNDLIGIIAACLLGLIGALILNALEALAYRRNICKLKEYIESLHCERRLSSDEQFDAVMAYIMAILGER